MLEEGIQLRERSPVEVRVRPPRSGMVHGPALAMKAGVMNTPELVGKSCTTMGTSTAPASVS
jgi:hypothetical protein